MPVLVHPPSPLAAGLAATLLLAASPGLGAQALPAPPREAWTIEATAEHGPSLLELLLRWDAAPEIQLAIAPETRNVLAEVASGLSGPLEVPAAEVPAVVEGLLVRAGHVLSPLHSAHAGPTGDGALQVWAVIDPDRAHGVAHLALPAARAGEFGRHPALLVATEVELDRPLAPDLAVALLATLPQRWGHQRAVALTPTRLHLSGTGREVAAWVASARAAAAGEGTPPGASAAPDASGAEAAEPRSVRSLPPSALRALATVMGALEEEPEGVLLGEAVVGTAMAEVRPAAAAGEPEQVRVRLELGLPGDAAPALRLAGELLSRLEAQPWCAQASCGPIRPVADGSTQVLLEIDLVPGLLVAAEPLPVGEPSTADGLRRIAEALATSDVGHVSVVPSLVRRGDVVEEGYDIQVGADAQGPDLATVTRLLWLLEEPGELGVRVTQLRLLGRDRRLGGGSAVSLHVELTRRLREEG